MAYHLVIVGVGFHKGDLTLDALDALQGGARVVLRTRHCGAAPWLDERRIGYETLDALYAQAEDFDELNASLARNIQSMLETSDVVYCVTDTRDRSAETLARLCPGRVSYRNGVPAEGALFPRAGSRPCVTLAASEMDRLTVESDMAVLVREIDTRELASELKLRLLERYPAEWQVALLPLGKEAIEIPLFALDRQNALYGSTLSLYVPAVSDLTSLERFGFHQLNAIMRRLRGEGGCPWDLAQTHQSLAANVIEEAYEVADAIERGDIDSLYDELGDLLLQVTLHAEIARQHGEFVVDDVTTAVCRKMISRHTHIFGGFTAETPEQALALWEQVKRSERRIDSVSGSMRAVTRSLPSLMRAEKVQKKAASVGFDWNDAPAALEKVYEEADELQSAVRSGAGYEEEMGDLLFSAVNVARLMGIEPELALDRAIAKFVARFEDMESLIGADGKSMSDMTQEEMDHYWARVKQNCVKT